ncbi:DoxX family protein [Alkalihalobacillus macyae]|uniref:DoxX family protein n=1 Tax=Guptibacillus hwajinpoensis TaxID=208199 RepID=UPI00273B5487|nr:DoxX family protein [Alkalihalobacillus macyae]MDP4549559.1 DoxX family protein [Alkalihalobacillus macyae]
MEKTMSLGRVTLARLMSAIVILFMFLDSLSKFYKPTAVVEGTLELGYSEHHLLVIGILGLFSVILYAFPKSSILGAVLLTGYFGGAIATHIRLDNPLFTHTLFPLYLAILAWGGIWLRDEKLRSIFPCKE